MPRATPPACVTSSVLPDLRRLRKRGRLPGARAETAAAFLEGRTLTPLDRAVYSMTEAAATNDFERAARWRDKFEQLEWLLAATSRARTAIDLLTFVYRDPGTYGDDRAYVVRRGVVRATYPWPGTPIELAAFDGVVAREREDLARTCLAPPTRIPRRDPPRFGLVPAAPRRAPPYHSTRRIQRELPLNVRPGSARGRYRP